MSDDDNDSGLLGLGAGAAAGGAAGFFAHRHLSDELAQAARNGAASKELNDVAFEAMKDAKLNVNNAAAQQLRKGELGAISGIEIAKNTTEGAKGHTVTFIGTDEKRATMQVDKLGAAAEHLKDGKATITGDALKKLNPENSGWVQKVAKEAERDVNRGLRGTEAWKKATGFAGIKGLGYGKVALITAGAVGAAAVAKTGFDFAFGGHADRVRSESRGYAGRGA